jgi:carbonic anhydrase/acetyltransferase-like protein (isoleucine patch superfamily)
MQLLKEIKMKKYRLIKEDKIIVDGIPLYRIICVTPFAYIEENSKGGYIEKESNLSQEGNAWVFGSAKVFGDARVFSDAQVYDDAQIYGNAIVYDDAKVSGSAKVFGDARVFGDAKVSDNANVSGNVRVYGDVLVSGDASVFGDARVFGDAKVSDNAQIYGNANVSGNVRVYGSAKVSGSARVYSNAQVYGNANVSGNVRVYGSAKVFGDARVFDNAMVYGDASVFGDAQVCEQWYIHFGSFGKKLTKSDILLGNTNTLPVNGIVRLYKTVTKDLLDFHTRSLQYPQSGIVCCEDFDETTASCAKGLHFSGPDFWYDKVLSHDGIVLAADIHMDDIITIQEGKVRCKKATIIGKCDL